MNRPFTVGKHDLPGWDDMSDLDKGAIVVAMWRAKWWMLPSLRAARFLDDPVLVALDENSAARHMQKIVGSFDELRNRIGEAEMCRLERLAKPLMDQSR
ncbi:hypothetical protein ACFV1N_45995 [Streptosporangium canum]|uniref:hypothetical protein n=1 Tax=Streptosporangium canum TaxID=324952 RepID=UPI0036B6AB43